MPRSRSMSIRSRYWARIWRGSTTPVICSIRSASVDLPWSMCAMMQKLRMRPGSVAPGSSFVGTVVLCVVQAGWRRPWRPWRQPVSSHALPLRPAGRASPCARWRLLHRPLVEHLGQPRQAPAGLLLVAHGSVGPSSSPSSSVVAQPGACSPSGRWASANSKKVHLVLAGHRRVGVARDEQHVLPAQPARIVGGGDLPDRGCRRASRGRPRPLERPSGPSATRPARKSSKLSSPRNPCSISMAALAMLGRGRPGCGRPRRCCRTRRSRRPAAGAAARAGPARPDR